MREQELNKIAKDRLLALSALDEISARTATLFLTTPELIVPESGFGFIYEFNNILLEKKALFLFARWTLPSNRDYRFIRTLPEGGLRNSHPAGCNGASE